MLDTAMRRALAAAGVVVAVAGGAVACGAVAAQDRLEQEIRTTLGADTATCPGDLDGTVGASITCTAVGSGGTFFVVAMVRAVEGGNVDLAFDRVGDDETLVPPAQPPEDLDVDSTAGEVDGVKVAVAVSRKLAATAGRSPDSVTCPDLPAEVGSAIRCQLVAGPDMLGLTVRVSSVQDGRVAFDVQVDNAPS